MLETSCGLFLYLGKFLCIQRRACVKRKKEAFSLSFSFLGRFEGFGDDVATAADRRLRRGQVRLEGDDVLLSWKMKTDFGL